MFMDPDAVAAIGKASLALKNAALAFIPITSVALSLRLYVRIFIVKGFGLDDVFLIGAQVSFAYASRPESLLTLYARSGS